MTALLKAVEHAESFAHVTPNTEVVTWMPVTFGAAVVTRVTAEERGVVELRLNANCREPARTACVNTT